MEGKSLIMMASYNGQDYIAQQIESIIGQSYSDWELYIRDDGSKDDTVRIIKYFVNLDSRIHLIEKENDIGGACLNFYELLRFGKSNSKKYKYYFLSDQDDMWDSEKLFKEVQLLKSNKPLLVYTDLTLMEEDGSLTNKRMSDVHDIYLKNQNDIFYNQIFIWGNTIGFNRNLMELIQIPKDISNNLSHDHYLAFYASAYGKIIYLDQPLTYYRRHADNVSELPPNYSPVQILKKMAKGIKPLIDGHAQSYCNVLYFIDNTPSISSLLNDVKNSYLRNGLVTIKVLKKYSIKPGSNTYNLILNYLFLITGLYKISGNYKCYKKNKSTRIGRYNV